jgi:hypothetical protein
MPRHRLRRSWSAQRDSTRVLSADLQVRFSSCRPLRAAPFATASAARDVNLHRPLAPAALLKRVPGEAAILIT